MRRLTTTSYAILGLLAIRPWSTYELAKQMAVSLRRFWPRAESKLYEEPKKLVAHGLATVSVEGTGRRARSVYGITAEGREALRRWLDVPGALPVLEFESLVKVFFAEHGSRDQLLATLRRVVEGSHARAAEDAGWARHYLDTGGAFPDRLPVIALTGRLQADVNEAVLRWAEWALATAEQWPDDLRSARPPWEALQELAARGAGGASGGSRAAHEGQDDGDDEEARWQT